MLETVVRTVGRYAMFARGERVGVAVSGGADSVCLLDILLNLAPRWELSLHVLHLDHQLRGEESDADARFVRDLAERRGLPFTMRSVEIAADPDNLEQAARRARLAFFRDVIAAGSVDKVAVGHTRSDQAETVLFRLLRGSGSAGLAGIRPVTTDGIVRPLIEVERSDVEAYLRERGISWREDSTNRSPEFARNRIRHSLLPQLEREWNPAIREILSQTADWAGAEEEYWAAEIDRIGADLLTEDRGAILLDAGRLCALPVAVGRRLVRRAMESVRGDLRGVDFTHVEAVLSLAASADGHGRVQAPGVDTMRSFDWLRFAKPGTYAADAAAAYESVLPVPGSVGIPGCHSSIRTELLDNSETKQADECVYNGGMSCVDWNSISGPLRLRNWEPGDQYQPAGYEHRHKLKDLFQQARIPLWERRRWPVVEQGEGIVWTRRFGPAARHAAGPTTRVLLAIREIVPVPESGWARAASKEVSGHVPGGREVS